VKTWPHETRDGDLLIVRVSFDYAADFFDETRGPPPLAMNQLINTLVGELRGHRTILDVGVGTGRFAKPFQDHGLEVVGVDIAERMLGKATEKGTRNLLRSDACFLPFRDRTFDASVCIHVLHLISDWTTALREICRVARVDMLSIVYTTRNPVRQAYNRILERYGFKSRRLGKGEWELGDIVRPRKSVFAATFDNKADELIEHLRRRAYSSQWKIPEDVNEKAVDEVRQQFGGKVFPTELRVLVWCIDDLRNYAHAAKPHRIQITER
jgi:ubiquinone/menaquinone biosynthesis C-methylase UbiE